MGYSQTTQLIQYTGYEVDATEFIADATTYTANTGSWATFHSMRWLERSVIYSRVRFRFEIRCNGGAGDYGHFELLADGNVLFTRSRSAPYGTWAFFEYDLPVTWQESSILTTRARRYVGGDIQVRNFSVRGRQTPIVFS